MKKQIVIMLTCSVILSMSACGNKQQEVVPSETGATESSKSEEATVETKSSEVTETEVTTQATEQGTVTGIVTDASMNYMAVQAQDGTFYMFSEDDATKVECKDGLLLGNVVDISYTGTQDGGDATAVTISDSTVTAKADREALEFAVCVIQTMQFMDQETLANMMTYPTYVGVGNIDEEVQDKDAMAALDRDTLFTEELLQAISDYNLFNLESTEAGFIIGDGKPNVIFKEDSSNEYGFGIVGING